MLKLLDDDHKHIREALVIAAKKLHISNMSLERILSLYRKGCTDSVPLCMSQHVGSMSQVPQVPMTEKFSACGFLSQLLQAGQLALIHAQAFRVYSKSKCP